MKFEHDCEHENGKRFVLMQEAYPKYSGISSTTTTLSAVTRTAPAIGGQSQTTEYVTLCTKNARRTTRITVVVPHRFRSACIIEVA